MQAGALQKPAHVAHGNTRLSAPRPARPPCDAHRAAGRLQNTPALQQLPALASSSLGGARGAAVVCRAAASAGGAAAADEAGPVQLPESREQAIQQAATAIAAQLLSGKKVKSKGFSGSGSTKFSVEIPVADSSGGAALALAQEVVAALPAALRTQFTIVDCSGSGSGNSGAAKVVTLAQCLADGRQLAGCLLVLGATRQQIVDVSRLLVAWRGPGAVLLNADWWADDWLPEDHAAFVKAFEAIYSFVPLEVKAFITTQQGAVFKYVRNGSPAAAPWRILQLEGTSWAGIARMTRRPSAADIETAFYNSSAAKSPLTAGAKFLRGLIPGQDKK